MQQYRLLRNNKEAGIYTFNELITLGLEPYDLVWVEGKSAAWKYPSEIEELKPYAPAEEEQPFERFYKKKTQQSNSIEEKVSVTEHQKSKPRYRIRADWQKVEMEKEKVASASATAIHTATEELAIPEEPKWKKLYSNWEQNHEEVPEENTSTNALGNLHNNEQKTIKQKKHASSLSIALGVLLIGGAGLYSGFQLIDKQKKQPNVEPVAQLQEVPDNAKDETAPLIQGTTQNQESVSFVNHINENTETSQATNKAQSASTLASKKEPAKKPVTSTEKSTIATQAVKTIPEKKNSNTSTTSASAQTKTITANTTTISTKTKEENAVSTTPAPAKKKMEDFVTVKKIDKLTGNAIQNIHLSIENKTDAAIDFVAIDVTYFDKSGKQQQTETLYAQNLAAHHSIAIKIPDNKNAVSISYKTSLLNIKKQGIYLMAE